MRRLGLALLALGLGAAPAGAASVPQPANPRATVVMIPGSGFNGARVANASRMSFDVASWRSWGFRTKIAAYRRGRAGLGDVTRVVQAAAQATPNLPLCVYGESSGGTWALLVTAQSGLVDCAIVLAAPTDQETLARAPDPPAKHLARVVWPRYFGPSSQDNGFEPFDVWRVAVPVVPVLAVYSKGDPIVPPQQGELLVPLDGLLELRVLRAGRHAFVHAHVASSDFSAARNAAHALVSGVSASAAR